MPQPADAGCFFAAALGFSSALCYPVALYFASASFNLGASVPGSCRSAATCHVAS